MPTPTKAAVHTDALIGGAPEPAEALQNPSFASLHAELSAAGVDLFDPTEALRNVRREAGEAFLRTDSHWSPAGVEGWPGPSPSDCGSPKTRLRVSEAPRQPCGSSGRSTAAGATWRRC